jgi:uncharacterized SAM-binding protein YcdF (DUF218 family)
VGIESLSHIHQYLIAEVLRMDVDLYHAKKAVSALLFPQYTALVLAFVGVVLWLWRGRMRAGICLMLFSGFYYLAACLPVTGFLLYRSLECRYTAQPYQETLLRNGVRHVVVMGDIREGVEAWRKIPGATLILSSGEYARIMARQAREMGVPGEAIVLETKGRDTGEQAREIKAMLGEKPFVLSTWAVHMWRALKTFRAEGLDPIPAPNKPVSPPRSFREAVTPCHKGWFMTTVGIHEYVGTLILLLKTLVSG